MFLTSSYDRAVVGGPMISQQIAAGGQGTRGLLLAFRQEQMGGGQMAVVPPTPAQPQIVTAPPTVAAPAEAATEPEPAPEPEPVAPPVVEASAPEPTDQMPSFLPGAKAVSMASFCNRTSLTTSANGGFVTSQPR